MLSDNRVKCSECNSLLRIPGKLLGKEVSCPKCKIMFVATADEAGDSVIPVEPVVEDEKSVPIAHPIVATTPDAERAFFERLSQSQDPSSNPDETSENPVLESEPLTQTDERIMTRKSARRKSRQADSNLTEPEQDVEEVNSARSRERLLIAVIMGSGLVLLCGLAGIGYIAYTLLGVKNKNIESVRPVDVPAPGATNPENLPPSINSYDTALAKVKASVVTVRATSADEQLTGSGFFVPGPGLVLTSARIVGQSKTPKVFSRIQVILGDEGAAQTLLATLIGADPELDLALLQVTSLSIPDPAPFDNLGSVKRGQQVFAFADPGTGNKRGVSVIIGSVTDLKSTVPPWIITTGVDGWAAGGPVTNEQGEVIGVTKLVPNSKEIAVLPTPTIQAFIRNKVKSAELNGPLAIANQPPQQPDRMKPDGRVLPKLPNLGVPFQPDIAQRVDPPIDRPNPARDNPKPLGPPKPPIAFPQVAPVEIQPAVLTADSVELKLPGKVTDACIGGASRYWFLYIPSVRQIAVFDVNVAKVVKYIPTAAETVRFAAGMNKLVLSYPDNGLLIRYDLSTFEKEVTLKFPFDGTIKSVAMGSASAGPLLVHYARTGIQPNFEQRAFAFLDLTKFQELESGLAAQQMGGFMHQNFSTDFRTSSDGKIIAFSPGIMGHGTSVFTVSINGAKLTNGFDQIGQAIPAADGTLFSPYGLFTSDLKLIGKRDNIPILRIPAQIGPMYLLIKTAGQRDLRNPNESSESKVSVYMRGDDRQLVTLPEIKLAPIILGQQVNQTLAPDKRVLFCPAGKLIGFIGPNEDKLILQRFDLEGELLKSGVDYLYVDSSPMGIIPGNAFKYPVIVKSKRGGVKLKLESGPAGMKIDGTMVSWNVPKDWTGPESILLTVSDASGQEVFHTFALSPQPMQPAGVVAAAPRVAVPPRPQPADDRDHGARPRRAGSPVRLPEAPFPITPTKAADKAEVKLPGPADAACMAGGGRFVLFRIPKVRQIAVLDVSEGKLVKTLPMSEDGALVAGGMSHIYVLNPNANIFQRWSLKTLEKEATISNPLQGTSHGLCMGHASDGPLLVVGPNGFVDGKTFQEIKLAGDMGRGGIGSIAGHPQYPPNVRVSADGRVYAWWTFGLSPSGLSSLIIGDSGMKHRYEHTSVGAIMPGPDGTLFTNAGLYTPELKKIKGEPSSGNAIPAAHGSFYLSLPNPQNVPAPPNRPKPVQKATSVSMNLMMLGESRPLAELRDLEGLDSQQESNRVYRPAGQAPQLLLTDRVFFVPEAKALTVLNGTADKVIINKIDVEELLKKADIDFLFVTSKPQAAERGTTFTYKPNVKSKKGGVKLKLDAAPDGMKVVADKIVWEVPKGYREDDVSVIVSITDAGGQEAYDSFTLIVKDK